MENYRRWIGYDWFKLVVALLLLGLFLALMVGRTQPVPVTGAALPATPAASVALTFDAASKALLNPQGVAVYTLSADGVTWQPLIPPDIQATLPSGYQLVQDPAAGWVIRDSAGALLYTWDMQALRWVAAPTAQGTGQPSAPSGTALPAAGLPTGQATTTTPATALATGTTTTAATLPAALPTATPATGAPATAAATATATAAAAAAATAPGAALTAAAATVPAVAPAMTATLPAAVPSATATAAPTRAPLRTPAATIAATPTPGAAAASPTSTAQAGAAPTSVPGCQAPVPSRLVVGKNARVLSNLNLRSAPALTANILTVTPAGSVVMVLQGPVCVPYLNSAYLWWQVTNPDGVTGWSAENYLLGQRYYLEPIQ